ncbi:MAG: hypothetical protein ABI651_04975 [Verrucomicrobiota bacterium]
MNNVRPNSAGAIAYLLSPTRAMATSGLGTNNRATNHPLLEFVEKSFPNGAPAIMIRITSAVPRNARRPLRLIDEMNMPMLDEFHLGFASLATLPPLRDLFGSHSSRKRFSASVSRKRPGGRFFAASARTV